MKEQKHGRGGRAAMPWWRQAAEGIGLVVALTSAAVLLGILIAVTVAWLY